MRLGLVLRKSVGEIRALPYPEFKRWWLFYLLEPWGWTRDDVNTARIVSMVHNSNVSKKKDLKEVKDFVSGDLEDRVDMIIKNMRDNTPPDLDSMSEDDRRAYLISQIKMSFGAND